MSPGNRWRSLSCAFVLAASLFLTGCTDGDTENKTAVVATYQGGQITAAEFEKQFHLGRDLIMPDFQVNEENKRKFLIEYITLYKVLTKQATDAGIKPDEAALDGQVKEYKEQVAALVYNGDQQAFEQRLKQFAIRDEDIKELARQDELLRLYKSAKIGEIKPTEEELQTYFGQHKGALSTGTVSHVLVKTEAEAKAVKERLGKGEDFAAVAKELSLDPTAKENGGRMADVQFDLFVPEFRDAAATLPLNTLSDPIRTEYGWHILRVDSRQEPAFDAVKADVILKVKEVKENAIWNDIYEKAQAEAEINVKI
ncbi:peptidylprolyl isomerase [Tumebacillus sp. DT12]|uniref:Peptidylprolyl isomerase n=1 Tax=Tumebacillus lacus TaxID=2995335 RepID=A0ABT3X506_9BACL|nr:peptidylprolyl isomerase [Tumebacillus lacus]MCX7571985.1 peptidylprolyl isomerase [Tumebacillus lacus]